jgi:hypothetical protein
MNGAANNGLVLMNKNESTLGWRVSASREIVSPHNPTVGGHLPAVKLS